MPSSSIVSLIKSFPDSERLPEYQFLEEYAGVKHQVSIFEIDPDTGRKALEEFLAKHHDNPLLASYQESEISQDFIKLMQKYVGLIKDRRQPMEEDLPTVKPILAKAGQMQDEAQRRGRPAPVDVREPFERLQQAVLDAERLLAVLKEIETLRPTLPEIESYELSLDVEAAQQPEGPEGAGPSA